MDLLSVATGYISAAFAENKKVKEFKDDFTFQFVFVSSMKHVSSKHMRDAPAEASSF